MCLRSPVVASCSSDAAAPSLAGGGGTVGGVGVAKGGVWWVGWLEGAARAEGETGGNSSSTAPKGGD